MPLFSPQVSPDQAAASNPNFDPSQASGGFSSDPQQQPAAPQPQGPAAPSSLQQAQADNAHHSLFGRAVKAMVHSLEGTRTEYNANPETGQIEESRVQGKPGQFFKNLLVGALVGGAAGSERTTDKEGRVTGGGGGFLGGFARGGAGALQYKQQQDQARYARAQAQQKAQLDQRKELDEESYHAALTAHENLQSIDLLHNMHRSDEKAIQEHNAASRAYQKFMIDAGASPYQFNLDGKLTDSIDGTSLQQAITKDPSILHAPPGMERHFFSSADLSELHFNGSVWTNDEGDPVNIGKNISIKAYDLSNENFKTPISRSGKEINAARRARVVDSNKNYMISGEGMSALYSQGAKDANENRRGNTTRQFTAIESKKAASLAKAEHEYNVAYNKLTDRDPDKVSELQQQLNDAKQDSQDAYEAEIEAAGGTTNHFEYPQPKPQTTPQAKPAQLPPGSRPILKDQKTVGYITADGKRVDY